MIITLKKDAPKAEVEKLIHTFENKGLSVTCLLYTSPSPRDA